ncbi:MAG: 23S rRNA (adenine(2503)-C(2))-methyltransferase RlmN [Deltaproteobacteria bacterium]|nr:23S rRNA (adenine(2503)-C(2))-methyltransferase RlmN [Deltaproteobacteria bacterium]
MKNFFDQTFDQLEATIGKMDPRAYRVEQVLRWVYRMAVDDFSLMTDMPGDIRESLSASMDLKPMSLQKSVGAADGTLKFLYRLADGELIESVLIPEDGHNTLCISTQAGCGMGCGFCESGAQGFRRNLSQGEILAQIVYAIRYLGDRRFLRNLVFMGMGEPLLNLGSLIPALGVILDGRGFDFSPRRVTVSTCGWVPGIRRLGRADLGVNLALSLNAADDETRSAIMPVNRKYPLRTVMNSIRKFPRRPRQRITFEYVLISGVNDRPEDAAMVVKLLHGIPAKVNIISYNRTSAGFSAPDYERMEWFQNLLGGSGLLATVRRSRGEDIGAACGQLTASAAGGVDG